MSGGGGNTQTVQKADPWEGLQPYLGEMFKRGMHQVDQGGPQYYPDSTYAGINDYQQAVLSRGWNRAMTGSPLLQGAQAQAQRIGQGSDLISNPINSWYSNVASGFQSNNPSNNYLSNVMQGAYLGKNPYLEGQFNAAIRPMQEQYQQTVMPGIASMFSANGRFGSNGLSSALAQGAQPLSHAMSDAASNIYGGAYQQERGLQQQAAGMLSSNFQNDLSQRMAAANQYSGNYNFERSNQMQAMGMAPSLANADYNDLDKAMGVGQFYQQDQQNAINANKQRWDFSQQQPMQNLDWLNGILQGGLKFGTQTGSEQMNTPHNPFMGAIGGGMMGGAIAGASDGAIGGLPGILIGALAGGLLGS